VGECARLGQLAQVGLAVHAQLGGERVGLAVAGEVGEQAVRARLADAHRRGPAAVALLARVQVLEAGRVAPHQDQVHALLVLDLEVAHGVALLVDDPVAQALLAAALEIGGVDDEPQPVLGDRESADVVAGACVLVRLGGVAAAVAVRCRGGAHCFVSVAVGAGGGLVLVRLALGVDRAARDRRAPGQERDGRGEGGNPGGAGHDATS
jgi:hypothetical protein